jgi:hypothetical protein
VERGNNGGFPVPVAGEPVRLVRCRHDACGTATRVRVPRELPAKVVRRVVCDGCHIPFDCDVVLDVGVVEQNGTDGAAPAPPRAPSRLRQRQLRPRRPRRPRPRPRSQRASRLPRLHAPGWLSNPESHAWRYLSIPVAAAIVVVALILIQGSGNSDRNSASPAGSSVNGPSAKGGAAAGGAVPAGQAAHGAKVIKGSSYTLALPSGWSRVEPKNGATFAAAVDGGGADATLWIRRDPHLGFPQFESRSLAQLHALAGSAHVVNRVAAPTAEATVVTLAADSPPGQPAYAVTLRVAGPYRYYLATTVDPDASRAAVDGADLIHNSFVPQARGATG